MKTTVVLSSISRQMEKLRPTTDHNFVIAIVQERVIVTQAINILNKKTIIGRLTAKDINFGPTQTKWVKIFEQVIKYQIPKK
jgi:hypothetical protein